MISPGTPSRARLAPRLTIPARDALVSFVFDDGRSDDPVMDFGDRWCEWDGGPPAPAEILETTGVDVHARTRVTIALAPNATHLAVARGRRLAVVATRAISEKETESGHREAVARARTCVAEVRDASGPDPEAYVTCMCWLGFAEPRSAGKEFARPRADASAAAVADLSVAVGTSDGRLRIYAADGVLLLSTRLDSGSGPSSTPSPVRALRARDARRSPSRDEVSEDLVAALDAAATRVDAVELRSALRRAHMLRGATQSQARFRASADSPIALTDAAHAPLATTRWDLARLAPVADAVSVGRLPPSVARAGLARADVAEPGAPGFIGGVRASSRGVGVLAAGLGDPRGDSGVVCLLASYDDDDAGVLDAAAALARKTASAAAATVSSLFGGAVSLAGAVTKKMPVGRALGGAVVGAVEKAGNAAGSAAAEASGVAGVAAGADDDARPLTWRSAWIDPPRRTRRFAPAPRGPLVAAADGLGRIAVLDVAAPATLAAARVIKGCRDAEMAWVEAPPPRGSNARVVAATGGLGALFLAVRSPKRNGGAVELWRCGGGGNARKRGDDRASEDEREGSAAREPGTDRDRDRDRDRDQDPEPFFAARTLQAATPFGAEAATSSPAAAVALAVASSKCYLLTPDGTLSEVLAP